MVHGLEDDLNNVIGPHRCTGWQDSGQSYLQAKQFIRFEVERKYGSKEGNEVAGFIVFSQ